MQQARDAVGNQLLERAVRGRDGRHSRGHRLHHHQPERLQPGRRRDHHRRPSGQVTAFRGTPEPDVRHVVPPRGPRGHLVRQRPGARDHQRQPERTTQPVPRRHQQGHALLLGQPAEEQHVLTIAGPAHAGVGDEVVLHGQPVRGQARVHEQPPLGVGNAEEPRDPGAPAVPVRDEVDGHRQRRDGGPAVAAVPHRGHRRAADAVRAHLAVAVQRAGRADQAVVVQRRHHRHPRVRARRQHRGRKQRERVVDVHHVRPLHPPPGGQLGARGAGPRPR